MNALSCVLYVNRLILNASFFLMAFGRQGGSRGTRHVVEQTFIWAHVRKAFGKPLITQPVIRQKFGDMFSKLEATQAFLEHVRLIYLFRVSS